MSIMPNGRTTSYTFLKGVITMKNNNTIRTTGQVAAYWTILDALVAALEREKDWEQWLWEHGKVGSFYFDSAQCKRVLNMEIALTTRKSVDLEFAVKAFTQMYPAQQDEIRVNVDAGVAYARNMKGHMTTDVSVLEDGRYYVSVQRGDYSSLAYVAVTPIGFGLGDCVFTD